MMISLSKQVGLLVSPDGHRRFMVVKFESEYDIVLKFPDEDSRLEFISDVENFLGSTEVGLGRERQEIREVEMLKMAVTKEHRTQLLEKFFKTAFSQVFGCGIYSAYRCTLVTSGSAPRGIRHVRCSPNNALKSHCLTS